MKKIFIFLILYCLMVTCCTTKNDDGKIDISSDEYLILLDSIFAYSLKNNEFLYYDGFTRYYSYIQVAIKPKKQISDNEMENQSKLIYADVLSELKKYNYKSGHIFKRDYEYINIYFYDYTNTGQLSRNGGPFFQIKVLEI